MTSTAPRPTTLHPIAAVSAAAGIGIALALRPLAPGPTASGWIVGVLLGVGIGVLLSAIATRPGPPTAVPAPVPAAPEQSLAEQLSADLERALPAGWVLGAPDDTDPFVRTHAPDRRP